MILQKYDSYKDSGVEWLGRIPKDWEVKRLKDLGKLQNGISQESDYFGEGFPFISYSDIYYERLNLKIEGLAKSNKQEQQLYSVKENDVFFTRTSETIEDIAYSCVCKTTIPQAIFSGFIIRLRPSPLKIYKGFSKYFFNAKAHRYFFVKEMNIVIRASLSQGILNQLPILLPTLEVQKEISNYLDKKTIQLDCKIALLEKRIVAYEDLKRALINEAICRGLNKNKELKNSGVEWIGDIPKHWSIERLKNEFNLIQSGIPKFAGEKEYLSTKSISINRIEKPEEIITYENKPSRANMQPILNSLWFAKLRFTNKSYLFINKEELNKYILSTGFAGLFSKTINEKFGYYYIVSEYFIYQKDKFSYGTTQEGINETNINQFIFIKPPLQEQIQIAKYLDDKIKKIDNIILKLKTHIETLKEFRKTLINDVVTGKVRVAE